LPLGTGRPIPNRNEENVDNTGRAKKKKNQGKKGPCNCGGGGGGKIPTKGVHEGQGKKRRGWKPSTAASLTKNGFKKKGTQIIVQMKEVKNKGSTRESKKERARGVKVRLFSLVVLLLGGFFFSKKGQEELARIFKKVEKKKKNGQGGGKRNKVSGRCKEGGVKCQKKNTQTNETFAHGGGKIETKD